MSVIVEDGSLVPNANSYASEANLIAFAAARNITLVGNPTTLLILAMDYIDILVYKGTKRSRDQTLQWPRFGVYIDGYPIDATFMPPMLLNGQMQTALAIDANNSPQQIIDRKTDKEKVGDLEVDYSKGSVVNSVDVKINAFLWKLLAGGALGSGNINVAKG